MVAVAASPTPGAAAISGKPFHHPPYKTMILSAIEALKDSKGSSKKAISKYIADNYSSLPTTHAALLTHHLRKLHQRGVLAMVKHSFKLPDSSAAVGSKKRGRPPKNPNTAPAAIVRSVEDLKNGKGSGKRGRPPKNSNPGRLLKAPAEVDPAAVYILPQAEKLTTEFMQSLPGAVAIILPEGLLNSKTARNPVLILPNGVQSLVEAAGSQNRMGRAKKDQESEEIQTVMRRRKAVVPKQMLLHKKPGRPPKNINSELSEKSQPKSPDSSKSPGSELKKKSVGRPRKTASSPSL